LGVGIRGISSLTSQRFLLLKVIDGAHLAARCSSGWIFENLSFIADEAPLGLTCRRKCYHMQSERRSPSPFGKGERRRNAEGLRPSARPVVEDVAFHRCRGEPCVRPIWGVLRSNT